ncbi:NUDIX domain-containing protein [Candidatus Daviesbacteria bacterium]|nr:NUDIX domain-containing protein [Candidatus Daviesbacteria bacterium]
MRISCETQDGKNVVVDVKKIILRVSVYGVLKENDSVLLVKTYLPLWEFPGGSVDVGETLYEGLKREFKEEAGLEIEPQRFLLERESFYLSPTGKVFHSFQNFFEVIKVKKSSNKVKKGARWVSLQSLTSKNMKKSAFDVIQVLTQPNQKYFLVAQNK